MDYYFIVPMLIGLTLVFYGGYLFGHNRADMKNKISEVGSLRIDNSIPEDGPRLFLELTANLSEVYSKKYVILKVNTKNYLSHE